LVIYTYTVNVLSTGVDDVIIDTLEDDILGNLDGQGNCSVPQTIAAGRSYSCQITVLVEGNAHEWVENTGTASGTDEDGQYVEDSDDARVDIEDMAPSAELTKTPEALVTFTVRVTNTSVSSDPLTLTALNDDIYGDLTDISDEEKTAKPQFSTDCYLPLDGIPIDSGDYFECSFEAIVTLDDELPETDTVEATVADDEGNDVSPFPSGSATVSLSKSP
jgi:hypothetical protein